MARVSLPQNRPTHRLDSEVGDALGIIRAMVMSCVRELIAKPVTDAIYRAFHTCPHFERRERIGYRYSNRYSAV
jgi:hypothetical protein